MSMAEVGCPTADAPTAEPTVETELEDNSISFANYEVIQAENGVALDASISEARKPDSKAARIGRTPMKRKRTLSVFEKPQTSSSIFRVQSPHFFAR